MLRHLLMTSVACGLLLPTSLVFAAEPVPQGTTMTMKFKVTVKSESKAEFSSANIHHVLTGQCTLTAQQAMPYSWDGPTAEQQAAAEAQAAQGQAAMNNAMGNQDNLMALQAEVEKCGDDEACITALTMKMANDPNFLAQQQAMQGDMAGAAALQPDSQPRYQQWSPQQCTGEMQADDTYVTSDPGGEGGDGAYTDTVTVKAKAPVDGATWPALFVEVDLKGGTTRYRMTSPAPVTLPSNSSLTGTGTRSVPLTDTSQLPILGPYKGGPGGQKGKAANLQVEWSKPN